jgi:SAM-dependent methyltransferase
MTQALGFSPLAVGLALLLVCFTVTHPHFHTRLLHLRFPVFQRTFLRTVSAMACAPCPGVFTTRAGLDRLRPDRPGPPPPARFAKDPAMDALHNAEAFWDAFGPAMFTPERLRVAETEAAGVLACLGLTSGTGLTLLDMPCGVGRHSIALARWGFEVTGVDRTPSYLARARRSAPPELVVRWVEGDMIDFDGCGGYDVAVNLYTSFGYFDDPVDNLRHLANTRRALKPGGRLVMDMKGKEAAARAYRRKHWEDLPDGSLFLAESIPVQEWRRMENRWILIKPDGVRLEHRTRLWMYSAAELDALLERAGFVDRRFLGSLEGAPYDEKAERLVAIARAG